MSSLPRSNYHIHDNTAAVAGTFLTTTRSITRYKRIWAVAGKKDSEREAALRRQLDENLRFSASRKLSPPSERLKALAEELAMALSERFPEK